MKLTKENLNLARIVADDPSRKAMTGIYVDPKRKVTAATNGAMLVEVSSPKDGETKFPNGDLRLAGEDAEPFILPAKAAREIAKSASFGAAVALTPKGKPTILAAADAKKSVPNSFEPVSAEFPDYRADGIFGKGDSMTLSFRADYLAKFIEAVGIGQIAKVTLFADRMRIESANDAGQSARGALMCAGKPAAPRTQAEPEKVQARSAASTPARSYHGGRHYYGRWSKNARVDSSRPPSPGQVAFYAYLVNRRDQKVTQAMLEEQKAAEKIEELKKNLPVDKGKCTWPQWRKLFMLLIEKKAEPKTVCEILNGLTDISATSGVIEEWIGKESLDSVEAAA